METNIDVITGEIVDAAYRIHRDLGPGLKEKTYERVLARALQRRGLDAVRQRPIDFEYDGMRFEGTLRPDLIVNERVLVEIKAASKNLPVFWHQAYTYLRVSRLQVALLLNFGMPKMKDGITRIVNGYEPPPRSDLKVNRR
jgi:iron complex transport system substrate-binding protein